MGIANLKALLSDERVWCVAARVEVLDGESSHHQVNDEGDLIVSCVTVVNEVPIWANLDSLAGGSGTGVWHIPDPGTEVMVAFDGGDFEGEAHIVSRTSGGGAPAGLEAGKVFVIGTNVEVRTPGGSVERTIKADTYRAREDSLFTALNTALVAINTYAVAIKAIADPSNAATPALTAALTVAFNAALATFQSFSASYLTTVLRAE